VERYRFVVFDKNRVNILNREFVASDDEIAIRMAEGWRDNRDSQVLRGEQLIKQWQRSRIR